jgi:hypothetical protein
LSRASRNTKFGGAALAVALLALGAVAPSHAQTQLPFQIDSLYTIAPGDPSEVPATDTFITSSGQLINQDVLTNNYTLINAGGSIDNQGTLTNYDTVENEGTIDNAGTFTTDVLGRLTNYGVINNQSGGQLNFINNTLIQNPGTINNEVGGTMLVDDGVIIFYNPGVINNHGDLDWRGHILNDPAGTIFNSTTGTVASAESWLGAPELENHGLVDNDGSFTAAINSTNEASGTIENSGTFMAGDEDYVGGLRNQGMFSNQGSGTLDVVELFYNEGQLISDGITEISLGGQFYNVATGSVVNNGYFWSSGGDFRNESAFTNNDSVFLQFGGAENTGTIVNNSSFEIGTIFTHDSGEIVNNGQLTIGFSQNFGGTISGIGTMTNASGGNVMLTGTLAPGNSTGTQSLSGDFTLDANASLDIELASTNDHDIIDVIGTSFLTINGNVNAIFYDSKGVSPGCCSTVMTTEDGAR